MANPAKLNTDRCFPTNTIITFVYTLVSVIPSDPNTTLWSNIAAITIFPLLGIRNDGLNEVNWLDQDDVISDNLLNIQYKLMRLGKVKIFFFQIFCV